MVHLAKITKNRLGAPVLAHILYLKLPSGTSQKT